VALPTELSGRELKGWSGCLRRGLPGGKEVGEEGRATGGAGRGGGPACPSSSCSSYGYLREVIRGSRY